MKDMARFFSFLILAVCLAASCTKEPVEQTLLELDRSHMKMTIGQSQKLNATVKGVEAECVWESADADVATVDEEGKVTAISAGSTKVAVSAAGMKKECEIVVVDFTAAKLELNKEFAQDKQDASKYTHMIMKDDQLQISPRFYNSDDERVDELSYPKYEVTDWNPSTEGTNVLSVDENGLVTALNPGDATVKVSGAGKESFVTLTVKSLELSAYEMSMYVNQYESLIATVLPESLGVLEKEVEWSSSAAEYVKVSTTGVVTALKSTTEPVAISARCGRLVANCMVTVTEYEIDEVLLTELEGLKAADETYQMLVGDNPYNLGVRFKKDGQDVSDMIRDFAVIPAYNSSEPDVAEIKNGILSVNNPGSTEITVTCAGKTTSFILNVIQCVESVRIIAPESNPYIVTPGDEFDIKYAVYPETASVKTVKFSSSDNEVATVDDDGKVTIHKGGNANIVITSDGLMRPRVGADGSKVAEPAAVNLILLSDPDTNPTSLTITGKGVQDGTLDLIKGDAVELSASVDSDYQGALIWNTSTPNVISVDENGRLTALSIGTGKVVLIAGGAVAELVVNVKGVDPTAIKINEEGGEYYTDEGPILLTASMISPANGDYAGVNWYSSDENVATVDSDGLVTVIGKGVVTITAKAKSSNGKSELENVTASVMFEFKTHGIEEVVIVLPNSRVEVGQTIQLGCRAIPSEAEIPNQTWTIIDGSDYADLTPDGLLTGKKADKEKNQSGFSVWKRVTVQLTVTVEESKTQTYEAKAEIEVIPKQPTGIELDVPQNNQLKIYESWNFNPRVLPADLSGFSIECYGTKPDGDYFTPNLKDFVPELPGTYSLTAYVGSNENLVYQPQRSISISVLPYWVKSVSIPETYELEQGSSAMLIAEFTSDTPGMEPYDKTLKWTSTNEDVVKVDGNGKLTAVAPGTAEVKVTTNGAWSVPGGEQPKSASCRVTVKEVSIVANVGDFYYSDGTISSEIIDGKTVVGIIISRDNAKSTDVKLPAGCTHGLVLALGQGEGNWSSSYDAGKVNTWALANGYQNTTGVYYAGGYVTNEYGKRLLGHNNTSALRGYIAANGYTSGIISALDEFAATVTLPASASELYIPSIAEMQMVHKNIDVINAALKTAGGTTFERAPDDNQKDLYWTTSENESSSGHAAALNPLTGELHGGVLKGSGIKRVRFIFAF